MKIKKMIYLFLLSVVICLAISLLWLFRNPSYEKIDKTFYNPQNEMYQFSKQNVHFLSGG